jgi:Outer membrane protein beta-barrel domain
LFLAVGYSVTVSAQTLESSGFPGHFGLKGGAAITRVAISGGTEPTVAKNKIDFNLGAMYRLRYHRLVFQPELLFNLKGGTYQIIRTAGRETVKNNFNYLSVPILFGYVVTEGLTVQAGPEFSYALNNPATGGPGTNTDLGAVVGVHYDFLDLLAQYSLHVRYIHGFNNVTNVAATDFRNRELQVSIVYNLYKKK